MKRCSTILVIKKMQNKTTMSIKSHPLRWLQLKRKKHCQEYGETGTQVHCQYKQKMFQLLWKAIQWFFRKLNIELLNDPANPFLAIYQKEVKPATETNTLYMHIHTQQHHSQQPNGGNMPNVHQQMKRSIDCGIYRQWSSIQL